jgi:hypothetical protein
MMPLAVACTWSCSKSDSESESDAKAAQGGTMATMSLPNQLNIASESLGLIRNAKLLGNPFPQETLQALTTADSSTIFGHSLADGIKSLKYRVSTMELCGASDGSRGDACDERPFSIYSEELNNSDYDTFVPGSAAVTSFTGWTDFMEKGALEELIGKVTYTDTAIGSYEAVIVRFYRTFKADAEVQMNNGEKLYTKNVTEFYDNGKSGLDVTYSGKSSNMTTGPSEEGLFFLPNGGKTFYLQRPFEITQEDVDNLVPYKMALAFDHNNFIKGSSFAPGSMSSAPDWVDGQSDDTLGLKIAPGFLEFAPILARENETIMRETYVLSTNDMPGITEGSKQSFSARITLYYVKEDATKAVRAVTSRSYYNEYSKSYISYDPVSGIRSITDGSAAGTINMYQDSTKTFALFKDFKRLTTAGESGTVKTELCGGSITNGTCSVSLQELTWTYTFVGESEAETELTFEAVPPPPPPAEDENQG